MKPIFIGGTGRSGTTILKRALALHPSIVSIPTEIRVIVDPGGALDLKYALSDQWSPYSADHAIHCFRKLMLACESTNLLRKVELRLLRKLGISPRSYSTVGLGQCFGLNFYRVRLNKLIGELSYHTARGSWIGSPSYQIPGRFYETNPLISEDVARILGEFFHDLFRHKADSTRQTHWIDDTPYNFIHVEGLLELFPDMKLIHIYRDPRDVLASYRRFSWGGDDLIASAQRLSNLLRRWSEARMKIPASSYMEVGLEELAASPKENIERICKFAKLEFNENLPEALAQINPDHVHARRWQHDFSKSEQMIIMPYLSPFIKTYGYEL